MLCWSMVAVSLGENADSTVGTMPHHLMEVNELLRRKLQKDPLLLHDIIDEFV